MPVAGRRLLLAALVTLAAAPAGAELRVFADPMQAFVDGYDPTDSDFFAQPPERTILLRIRADFDNDGVPDLAVSEQSPWGKAGGPWLLFLGQRAGGYRYVGSLFFTPGRMAIRPTERGVGEVVTFAPTSAERGTLAIQRVSRSGLQPVRTTPELADGASELTSAFNGATAPAAETCGLLQYRRDRLGCWRPYGMLMSPPASAARPWTIVPGVSGGPLGPATSEADLVARYGARSVTRDDIDTGEGGTEPGTRLFPGEPERMVEIFWKDPQRRTAPKRIVLSGERSVWSVEPGITLGTSLMDLERLNGGPFMLSGFGWDYEGTVESWEQGRLELRLTRDPRVRVRLAPPPSSVELAAPLAGETLFRSDLPLMRQVNPRVYQIEVEYR